MISTVLSLERYKKLRVKYATQIEDGMFDPNGFIEDMKPFFADRERKYLAYTSEKNEIDNRPKPNTDIVKVNNKLHAGMYSIVVDKQSIILLVYLSNGITMYRNKKEHSFKD